MKLKKILAGVLAVMMTITAVSLTIGVFAEGEDTLVIPYTKIQKGNVDRKIKAEVDAGFNDAEKGIVVKITPTPNTTEQGEVNIDGYGLESLNIDMSKWNYLSVDYKYVSDIDDIVKPTINFLPGPGKVFRSAMTITSNETLVKNQWATMTFNIGSKLKPLLLEGKKNLSQIHFRPFGGIAPSRFSENDYILISSFTFSMSNPNGDTYYTVSFSKGDAAATGTAPEPIKARYDDTFILPEIPFTNEGKTAQGWLASSGTTVYKPGTEQRMPEGDASYVVVWKSEFVAQDSIELAFPTYFNGICDKKDTATTETIDLDGMPVVAITPNPLSTSGAINLDGWSYGGAKINVEAYKTLAVLYRYDSDNPVSGPQNLNIMRQDTFDKAPGLKSREGIIEGRWAVASFDLTPAIECAKPGIEPIIKQMHYYPLGSNKAEVMSDNDRVYVAKMFVVPEASQSAVYHESFMTGYADGTFGVTGNMTRAEACTIVARLMAGGDSYVPAHLETAFKDVANDQWYHKYVSYVESLGYLKSYGEEFLPNQAITRAEFVELVYNMGLLFDNGKNGTFTDVPADHPKAAVVAAAGKAGLVNGYANGDGTFRFAPDATITRAEVVKVINNAYGKTASADGIFNSVKDTFSDVTPDHWAFADIIDAAVPHVSYIDEKGAEVWMAVVGGEAISEDFDPDYETGKAKLSEALALFDKRVEEILSTPSPEFKVTGKTYYVSASEGSDANDGKSPEKAFKTATRASQEAKKGDLVLFKRGDMWRERWSTVGGVTYSAYGEGEKPYFNGNLYGNAADESLWTLVPGTTNIWKYKDTTSDIGNIVLNDGDAGTIEKIVPTLKDGQHIVDGKPFDPTTSFAKDLHFISIYNKVDPNSPSLDNGAILYVRCDAGNPGKIYDSIEIAHRGSLVGVKDNVTIDNIKIRYSGSHGFGMGTVNNVRFQNLEVGYIGGTAQYYSKGSMVRFGNGIEVYGGCNGFYIDNCYVYQCYDAGITNQYSKGGTNNVIEENVFFTNNVIDKCIYNIEYFMGQADIESAQRILRNIEYSGNILARSGYGWGMSPGRSASIKGWDHFNRSDNFVIKNNTFILDRYNACHLGASMSTWLPTFEGNTYIQRYGNTFTKIGANGSTQYNFLGTAAEKLEKEIGEKNFKLYYVPADTEVK